MAFFEKKNDRGGPLKIHKNSMSNEEREKKTFFFSTMRWLIFDEKISQLNDATYTHHVFSIY